MNAVHAPVARLRVSSYDSAIQFWGFALGGMTVRTLPRVLRALTGYPSRAEYERHLRSAGVIAVNETIADRSDIAPDIYRDWQRRSAVACVFARLIALKPSVYDIAWEVVAGDVVRDSMALAERIAASVERAKGQEEAVVVLLPSVDRPEALVAMCKALGRCNGWSVRAPYNPSDKLERVYVRVTTQIASNVEAEVLGLGPFEFLPPTRLSPLTALHVRTKTERAKRRTHDSADKAHLADIDWPEGRGSRFQQFWEATVRQRLAVLGGDDSAARARITFAIPQGLWDAPETGIKTGRRNDGDDGQAN